MSPEIERRLPPFAVKAIEKGAIGLAWKAAQTLGWALIIWGVWSLKGVANTYIENHPTITYLKAQATEEDKAVASTQNTVREISVSLERMEHTINTRFDKADAQASKLQDRLDRHMELSHP